MQLSNNVIRPIITEKSFDLANQGKYVFEVSRTATKYAVAKDLKTIFGVDVLSVRTIVLPGKQKRIIGTRKYTKTSNLKKAVVKLKEGQKIELFPKE